MFLKRGDRPAIYRHTNPDLLYPEISGDTVRFQEVSRPKPAAGQKTNQTNHRIAFATREGGGSKGDMVDAKPHAASRSAGAALVKDGSSA